jgi:hypothetical protein
MLGRSKLCRYTSSIISLRTAVTSFRTCQLSGQSIESIGEALLGASGTGYSKKDHAQAVRSELSFGAYGAVLSLVVRQ